MELDLVGLLARARRAVIRHWMLLGLALGMAACGGWGPSAAQRSATPTPKPTPTLPPLVVVQRPVALEFWDARLSACAQAAGLLLAIEPVDEMRPSAEEAVLWHLTWGDPGAGQEAYALGPEAWGVLVQRENPVHTLPAVAWPRLWTSAAATWAEVGGPAWAVVPVVPLPSTAFGRALTEQVGPSWRLHPRARLAPTPAQAVQQVAADPAALALVPRGWWAWARHQRADLPWDKVRLLPEQAAPSWQAEVVLWSQQRAGPLERRWAGCLAP